MLGQIIFYTVSYLFHFVLLLAGLWGMLKIQKFNYNWPGLLGSAVLASGLDMIPVVGHYCAVPVLYICIWKMTRESIFPDAAFTVLFSYLFMFVVNMFLITFLTGDLRPDLRPEANSAGAAAPTNATMVAPANPEMSHAAVDSAAAQKAEAVAKSLSVKGLIRNGSNSVLVLGEGAKNRVLGLGEEMVVQTAAASNHVRFENVDTHSVTLSIDGTPVKLKVD
jgi:hypothetical protein